MNAQSGEYWRTVLENLKAILVGAADRLEDKAMALARERADDSLHQNEREEAKEAVREKIFSLRSIVAGMADDVTAEQYGLTGQTPTVAAELETEARQIVRSLRADDIMFQSGEGLKATSADLADGLEQRLDRLSSALENLEDEKRKEEALLVERNQAQNDWKDVYRGVAGMVEEAFRIVGEHELADRLRPIDDRARGADSTQVDDELLSDDEASPEGESEGESSEGEGA